MLKKKGIRYLRYSRWCFPNLIALYIGILEMASSSHINHKILFSTNMVLADTSHGGYYPRGKILWLPSSSFFQSVHCFYSMPTISTDIWSRSAGHPRNRFGTRNYFHEAHVQNIIRKTVQNFNYMTVHQIDGDLIRPMSSVHSSYTCYSSCP